MPSRHDMIHLVGKRASVCCETGFASYIDVSIEWHALCVHRNHDWVNITSDMEHRRKNKKIYAHIFKEHGGEAYPAGFAHSCL